MNKKRKPVASVSGGTASSKGGVIVGFSDVIRWGDVMTVQGWDIDVAKAVELGLKYDMELARKLEEDLKSKKGLLLTFPIAKLMSDLQVRVGSGEELHKLVGVLQS